MHFSGVSWYSLVTRGTRCAQYVEHVIYNTCDHLGSNLDLNDAFTCVNQRLVRWSRTRSCPTASGRENRPAGPRTCFKPNLNGNNYRCILWVQWPLTNINSNNSNGDTDNDNASNAFALILMILMILLLLRLLLLLLIIIIMIITQQ